jgi:hypothetical protein
MGGKTKQARGERLAIEDIVFSNKKLLGVRK